MRASLVVAVCRTWPPGGTPALRYTGEGTWQYPISLGMVGMMSRRFTTRQLSFTTWQNHRKQLNRIRHMPSCIPLKSPSPSFKLPPKCLWLYHVCLSNLRFLPPFAADTCVCRSFECINYTSIHSSIHNNMNTHINTYLSGVYTYIHAYTYMKRKEIHTYIPQWYK